MRMIRTKSVTTCSHRFNSINLSGSSSFPRRIGSVQSFHLCSKLSNGQVTLAIKAEHPNRLWERRTPLIPDHVQKLVEKFGESLSVKVESSQKRIFDDQSYVKAGAELVAAGGADGDVVMAIKEIPIEDLKDRRPGKPRTYLFFSHTHKGQSYNIPLLKRMVKSGDQFIDWELLVNPQTGAREVSFGRLAGVVGAGESLSGYGLSALKKGFSTPFLNLARPYTFKSTAEFFDGLKLLRSRIVNEGYRGPMLGVVVTGSTGRVGKGIVETLDHAGIVWAENLAQFQDQMASSESSQIHHRILGYKAKLEDYIVHQSAECGQIFDRAQYNAHPEQFRSVFHETVAPWTTLLINGAYWSSGVPRLLSNDQLAHLFKQPNPRLAGVADISCDFHGGLEFVDRATTIEAPYADFKYDHNRSIMAESQWTDVDTRLQLISIEILPSELPKDASEDFSSAIFPYITSLIQSKLSQNAVEVEQPELLHRLKNGMICGDGKLMPQHEGLTSLLADSPGPERTKPASNKIQVSGEARKVVIFGSGLVAKPAIETLLQEPNVEVIIAAKVLEEAESLSKRVSANDPSKQARMRTVQLDAASDRTGVSELVKEAHIVMSLLPAPMHPLIATACLAHSVNLITASYVSPAMAEFDQAAKSKNLIFLNELGLDPGIDHMTAVSLIQRLKRDQPDSRIKSFVSFCGGLPEHSDGLLGYRFSWSPKGVLEAAGNPAQFLLAGKKYEISGEKLLKRRFTGVGKAMFDGKCAQGNLALEGMANRDSLGYISRYGLDTDNNQLETMLRGTLRYEGFCEVMHVLKKIGLVRKDKNFHWGKAGIPTRWDQVIEKMGEKIEEGRAKRVLMKLGLLPDSEGSGLVQDDLPKMPSESDLQKILPIDLLCQFLSHKLQYGPNERDLVLLSHEIRIESGTGEQKIMKSELIARGDQENSAMAKTVGSPIGIGALVVLNDQFGPGRIPKGVVRPVEKAVWESVLNRLESESQIRMVENQFNLAQARALIGGGLENVLRSAVKKW
ncbi:hypothetical protein Pst134EA_017495 [Puccinia striiformis f. sp. tritici]|uniref:hypothetical protein n=1 Tax=Puccinia striiformis f. sp. tritici TaxID=168172 RepID=UPI002008E4E9|nr:hypothetical protein Pst134EA_017495 [Puccinia striiformis f. sp. tritici]KAH9461185.1 hypothetical protein Pst134EA_017495 [Puccinia striiformis f. sp. tritici]